MTSYVVKTLPTIHRELIDHSQSMNDIFPPKVRIAFTYFACICFLLQ